MRNAIILHGRPSKEIYYSPDFPTSSNFAWIPWLQKHLIINDIKADTPEIPHSYEPNYKIWKQEFERFDICEESLLVGHSAGAGFIVRWLSESPKTKVKKVILVAPGFSLLNGNMDFIDHRLNQRVEEIIIFISDNDKGNASQNTKILCEKIDGIRVQEFKGYGHFISEHMDGPEFPELLQELLN
jgi:predicted alpha/beta hydrolase family esterase